MKILSAVDGSPHAEAAMDLLTRIPFPGNTELVIVNVLEEPYLSTDSEQVRKYFSETLHDQRLAAAKELLTAETERVSPHFGSVRIEQLSGHAAHEITALADSEQADLVVLGARGMNALERFLLGSTSEKVVRHAPCSVLIAHKPEVEPEKPVDSAAGLRFLVTCDGSDASNEAIETLTRLPLKDKAEIRLLAVHSLVTSFRMDVLQKMSAEWYREQEQAQAELEKAARHLESAGVHNVCVGVSEADDVTTEILNVADKWNADIIMAGNTGKGAVDRFLLGSVSKRIVRHAPCSVWITRTKETPENK